MNAFVKMLRMNYHQYLYKYEMTAPHLRQQVQREWSFLLLWSFTFSFQAIECGVDEPHCFEQFSVDFRTVINTFQL